MRSEATAVKHDRPLEAEELGDRSGEAGAAGNIAQICRSMGRHEEALAWAEESARVHRELGDRVGEGMSLTTMASIHREWGNLETALSFNLKTLRYNDEAGVKNLNVAQNNTYGTLYLSLGQPRETLEHFREAARLAILWCIALRACANRRVASV